MDKKRLLVFHPSIAPYRIDFFNDLSRGFETLICLEYWNLKEQKFDYDEIYRQFVFKPDYLPQGGIFKKVKAVADLIRSFKPDIVITSEYSTITLVSLFMRRMRGIKYRAVVMTDDNHDMLANGNDFSLKHKLGRLLLAPFVDDVIVIDSYVRDYYRGKYGRGIYFPIIVDERKAVPRYSRIMDLSRQLAEKYSLQNKKVLLSVSRLVPLKNIGRVIDAFSASDSDAVLVIVGDGPERHNLEQHASSSSKRIIFPGRFEGNELYAWYNLASVFILASYQEAFGAVTNEALLAGCRVIVSRVAGSSCLVNSGNGELIDPMNVDGIAAAVDRQMAIAGIPDLVNPRPNLMPVSYSGLMDKLISELDS